MKLKQLFCRHKKLTAIDQYIPIYKSFIYTTAGDDTIVQLKCDKCGKLIEMELMDMQYRRHNFYIDVDVRPLEKYITWGGKLDTPKKLMN